MIRNIAHSTRTVLHSLLSALLYCAPAVSAEPPADSTAPRPQLAAGLYRVAPFDAARMNEFVPDWLKRGTPVAVPFVAETDELRHAVVSSEPSSGAVAVMLLARPPGTQESLLANTSPQKRPDDVTSAGQGPQPGCQVWRWRVEPTLYAPDLAPASSSGCTSALQYQLTALDASFVLQSSVPLAGQISMNVEQSVALSQFNLVERRAYADILYLPRSVALRVYPSSDAALSHVRPELPAGSYVALRSGSGSESPEWLHVDFLAPDGEATSGWLESLDVIPGRRVNQQQQTHDHRFEVVVSDDDDAGDGYLSWQGILAVHKKTGMKHILPGSGEGRLGPSERLLTVVDANFDGHPDIMIGATDGGAGPNSSSAFYLFDPATQRFVYHDGLSMLTQVQIDPRRKTISSASRNSCCSHSSSTYRFIRGELLEIANLDESLSTDGKWTVTTSCALRGKELVCRQRRNRVRLPR